MSGPTVDPIRSVSDVSDGPPSGDPVRRPQGAGRWLAHGVVVTLLACAALAPLRYYLGDDPHDERFAWRMFSGVRLRQCQIRVVETMRKDHPGPRQRLVDPGETVHPSFENLLRRVRRPVVDAFLEARCARSGGNVAEVRYANRCFSPGGSPLPVVEVVKRCGGDRVRWP